MPTILSLCDYTGAWALPYAEAGYRVILVDPKHATNPKELHPNMETISTDVRLLMVQDLPEIHGILMAPPCTHFSSSGAQYWKAKDADGRTLDGLSIVDACLRLAVALEPIWWLLENPVGRLPRYIGPYQMTFQPHFYGDAYTKKTCLFGDFNVELPQTPVEPERVCIQGSWIQKLGGSSEKTKELRSITPSSFARAFFQANP